MTPKRYLSNKKTKKQTISISPELKKEIEEFCQQRARENSNDPTYKSISSFYTYVMNEFLAYLEEGGDLTDLYNSRDSSLDSFYDKFSYKSFAPIFEEFLEPNRYEDSILNLSYFLLSTRNLYVNNFDPYNLTQFKEFFEKLKSHFKNKELVKNFKIDIKTEKQKRNIKYVFEMSIYYKNICFENIKYNAVFFGYLGAKVNKVEISKDGIYSRMEAETTDLFFNPKSLRAERRILAEQNLKRIINLSSILEEDDLYLWTKLAMDKDIYISFKNFDEIIEIINNMVFNSQSNGILNNTVLKQLKFFEKLHWIKINNEQEYSFNIIIPEKGHDKEIQFLKEFLSKSSKMTQVGDNYYLE